MPEPVGWDDVFDRRGRLEAMHALLGGQTDGLFLDERHWVRLAELCAGRGGRGRPW